jgi:phosphatidylglycerol phospholipase C
MGLTRVCAPTDVHVTSDNYVLCCHDPHLDRTTTGHGMICDQAYVGGIDRLATLKSPAQPVPTFRQVVELLCQPGFDRAVFNIDVRSAGTHLLTG